MAAQMVVLEVRVAQQVVVAVLFLEPAKVAAGLAVAWEAVGYPAAERLRRSFHQVWRWQLARSVEERCSAAGCQVAPNQASYPGYSSMRMPPQKSQPRTKPRGCVAWGISSGGDSQTPR